MVGTGAEEGGQRRAGQGQGRGRPGQARPGQGIFFLFLFFSWGWPFLLSRDWPFVLGFGPFLSFVLTSEEVKCGITCEPLTPKVFFYIIF